MKRLRRALANFRRQTNIETQAGFLGDGTGETHDRNNPGNFWVRFPAAAGGLTTPVSLPLMVNANLKPDDGIMVEVGMWKNRPVILGARLDSLAAAGINPIQLNPADPTNQYLGPVNQNQITTFQAMSHGDVTNKPFYAVVMPGVLYVSGVPYFFTGSEINISSLVPSAGEHCFAAVFIKSDLTLEAFGSTAIADVDPLSDVDLREADALKTFGSYPVWAWELRGDDTALSVDPARQVDLRRAFSPFSASASAVYTPTNVTPDRSYDANSTTIDELADILGTLIADLQAMGLIG